MTREKMTLFWPWQPCSSRSVKVIVVHHFDEIEKRKIFKNVQQVSPNRGQFHQHSTGSFYASGLMPILLAHCVVRESWAYFLALRMSKVLHIFVGETKLRHHDYRRISALRLSGWWNWPLVVRQLRHNFVNRVPIVCQQNISSTNYR